MEWVKTTAKTLPEAIDLALDNLGVDESEAEIVVLEEPRQGLFGRMRGTARVEARVKPKPIRPKNERNRNRKSRSEGGSKGGGDRNRNRSRNRGGGKGGQGGQGGSKSNDRGDRNDRDRNRQGGKKSEAQGGQRQGADNDSKDGRGQQGRGGRDGGQRGSKGRSNDKRGRDSQGQDTRNREHDTKPKEETPVEEVATHLETFLSDLTKAFGFDSDVTVDSSEADVLVGKIEGQHGLLVGPKGRTLDAVQELARISCQRTVPSSIRIKVDVGGYREKRVEALQEFARQAADKAAESQLEVALEPMSPADRKAIHDALSEDDRVETRSVGAEPRRKVLIEPVITDEPEDDQPAPAAESMNGADADSDADSDAGADADESTDSVDEMVDDQE